MTRASSTRLQAADRRQQLIEAATHLFAQYGFDGTSTRQIARVAKVNEAIIFRHFTNKEELYWAVVSQRISAGGHVRALRHHLSSDRAPREVLASIARNFLDRSSKDAELTRLLLFSALRNPELTDGFFRSHMADAFELLSNYFRRGIRAGVFRKVDPVVAARGFFGTIYYHNLVQELYGGDRYKIFDKQKTAQEIADIWLSGVSATGAVAKSGMRPVLMIPRNPRGQAQSTS